MKYKITSFLIFNLLFIQSSIQALSAPPLVKHMLLADVDVDKLPHHDNTPIYSPKIHNTISRNTFEPKQEICPNLVEPNYFVRNIKIAGKFLGVFAVIIGLIKLYDLYKNAQNQKKIDNLHRIIATNSWDEEDPKLLEELYWFVCELRDHPDCKEQKEQLSRVVNCFPEEMRKEFEKKAAPTSISTKTAKQKLTHSPEGFFLTFIFPYLIMKDYPSF